MLAGCSGMGKSLGDIEHKLRDIWNELPSADKSPPRARDRHIAALMHTAEYFESNGISASIVHEFRVLALALRDLEKGTVAPFLKAERAGRVQDPTDVWLSRAMVAIAIDLLCSDMSARDAAKFVASTSKGWARLFSINDFEERARKWREELKAGKVKNTTALHVYATRSELIEAERAELGLAATPESIARNILRYAAVHMTKASGDNSLRVWRDLGD